MEYLRRCLIYWCGALLALGCGRTALEEPVGVQWAGCLEPGQAGVLQVESGAGVVRASATLQEVTPNLQENDPFLRLAAGGASNGVRLSALAAGQPFAVDLEVVPSGSAGPALQSEITVSLTYGAAGVENSSAWCWGVVLGYPSP